MNGRLTHYEFRLLVDTVLRRRAAALYVVLGWIPRKETIMSQTKICPNCGCDTYLSRCESGKCPHCGAKVE